MFIDRQLSPSVSGRVDWIDGARGVGILLVVYGHALRGQLADVGHAVPRWAALQDAIIYAFHMPLFFFLAGLFLQQSLAKGRGRFMSDKLWTIAYPYLLWSLVAGLIELLAGRLVNSPIGMRDLLLIPVRPIEQFWFLYCLFLCQMVAAVVLPHRAVLVALAIAGICLAGMAQGTILAPAFASLIYLVTGMLAMPGLMWMADCPAARLMAVSALAWVVFAASIAMPVGVLQHYAAAFAGSIGTIAAAMAYTRGRRAGLLRSLGEASLAIYVLHTIVSAGARIMLDRLGLVLPLAAAVLVCTAAGVIGPWVTWHLACRYRLTLAMGFGRGPSPQACGKAGRQA